jgi:phage-related protein
VAEAFLRLRVDASQVKKDIDAGLKGINTGPSGSSAGNSYGSAFLSAVIPHFGKAHAQLASGSKDAAGKAGVDAGKTFGTKFSEFFGVSFKDGFPKELGGAIAPGILGTGALKSSAVGIATALVGALPAAFAIAGVGAAIGAAVSIDAIGAKLLIGTKKNQGPLYDAAQNVGKQFQTAMQQAATGMQASLQNAFNQVPSILGVLQPLLHNLFAAAGGTIQPLLNGITNLARTAIPLLAGAIKAVTPLIQPVIGAFTQLIAGLLPGLINIIHAAAPAITALAVVVGGLGRAFGNMLSIMAPALQASSVIFTALGNLLNALFPIIGKLAVILATTLAPLFTIVSKAIQSLLPFLTTLGNLFAAFAGAILNVLATGLSAIAKLLEAIAPALNAFVGALAQVFTVLENKGVLEAFGNALVALVGPLSQLINGVLKALTPIIPIVLDFFLQLSGILTTVLIGAIRAILPGLTQLVIGVLGAVQKVLPVILPLILLLATTIGTLLTAAVKAVLPGLLAIATVVLVALVKLLPIVLPPLLKLATSVFQVLAAILPVVLPLFINLTRLFTVAVVTAITGVATALAAIVNAIPPAVLGPLVLGVTGLVLAIKGAAAIQSGVVALVNFGLAVQGNYTAVVNFVKAIPGFIAGIGTMIATAYAQVAAWVADAAAATAAFVAENAATLGLAAVVALAVAGIIYALTHLSQTWHALNVAWDAVASALSASWNAIFAVARTVFGAIASFFAAVWAGIKNNITTVVNAIGSFLSGAWNSIRAVASAAWGALATFFTNWWNAEKTFFTNIVNAIGSFLSAAWNSIRTVAQNVWNAISSFFSTWWGNERNFFGQAVDWIAGRLSAAWTGIKNTAEGLWAGIKAVFDNFWRGLKSGFQSAVDAVTQIWAKLHDAALTPVKFIVNTIYNNGIVKVVDAIAGVVGLHPLNPVKGFASGTSGADPGWAWVGEQGPELVRFHGGEHVMSSPASLATGLTPPGYAKGTSPPIGVTRPVTAEQQLQHQVNAKTAGAATGPNIISAAGNAAVSIAKAGINGIRNLVGDALGAGINAVVNPLINAIPGTNTGIGKYLKSDVQLVFKEFVDWVKGASQGGGAVGSGSGASVAQYAKSFATGVNHPYVTGGATPSGWDCSGFSAYVYDHFGYFPGKQGQRYGTSESQWADTAHLQPSGAVPGALAFFQGSGYAPPGHVGVVINSGQYASAYDHAEGTVIKPLSTSAGTVFGFRIPKGGFRTTAPGGAIPGGAPADRVAWAKQILAGLGIPASPGAVAAMAHWAVVEGGNWNNSARFNPLNTTYPEPGATSFGVGIKSYTSWAQGDAATIATLQGGAYAGILAALRAGNYAAVGRAILSSPWGTTTFDNGGTIPEPISGTGPSGRRYTFQAGETIQTKEAADAAGVKLDRIAGLLGTLIDTTRQVPAGVGRHVGGAIGNASSDAAFRSRYPRGGF